MKLIKWIVDFNNRHYREIRNYEKGGVGARIIALIFVVVFASSMVGAIYWFFECLNNIGKYEFIEGLGIFLLMVLCIMLNFDYALLYTVIGFKMSFRGVAISASKRVAIRAAKRKGEDIEESLDDIKTHKALDLFVGIFSLAVLVGSIVVTLAVLKNFTN